MNSSTKSPSQGDILNLLGLLRPHRPACGNVRIGSEGDGGYVVPDLLDALDAVISIGIGNEVSFDAALADRGVPVFQYDHTVDTPPVPHRHFTFRKIAWGRQDSLTSRSLDGMLTENNLEASSELLLKFDVEGHEWEALADADEAMFSRFRIITAEFHGFGHLEDPSHFKRVRNILQCITRTHVSTHIHANNCCGVELVCGVPLARLLEVTFVRRADVTVTPDLDPIPGPLDFPNVARVDDIVLTPWGVVPGPVGPETDALTRAVLVRTAQARDDAQERAIAAERQCQDLRQLLDTALNQRDGLIEELADVRRMRSELAMRLDELAVRLDEQVRAHAQAADARAATEQELMAVRASRSWRWTSRLRSTDG